MKSNVYLYMILISLLVGGFTGFIGYDNMENADKTRRTSENLVADIETRKKDREAKLAELEELYFDRREKQIEVRELAASIIEQEGITGEFQELEAKLRASVSRQDTKRRVNQEGVSEMQDQLIEDTTSLERQEENMTRAFEADKERLRVRQSILQKEDEEDAREKAKELSILGTEIDQKTFEVLRETQLPPTERKTPWVVGSVLDFNAFQNKIILSVGWAQGVKQNFKFMVFSETSGQERVNKGFIVVKQVDELISTGVMMLAQRETADPVSGDLVGSLSYREGGLNYYLEGDFRAKYTKDELERYLIYNGNRVLLELTSDVDFFVMGPLASPQDINDAISLGVTIIPEEFITPYLGE